ncbi:hypothetical protein PCASD_19715 [Puccinia coronata f. sp. avenae]|uniref:DUF4124 domain-containing protein n=1 Tax=Puccinia coronata f. sp. avenae TaxID=200324 RepID=A0A2N5SRI8_9BASI|nr:hypothetical protein PCASD_19715 [Puccinia coronata f. sp. avenae]
MHHPLYMLSLLLLLLSATVCASKSVIHNGKYTFSDEKNTPSVTSTGITQEALSKDKDKGSGGRASVKLKGSSGGSVNTLYYTHLLTNEGYQSLWPQQSWHVNLPNCHQKIFF